MTIQGIVRPFQTRDISPAKLPQQATADITTTNEPLTLEWGKQWNLSTANGSISIDVSYYAIRTMRERVRA